MEHPDALGIVGGVAVTEDSVAICPGDRFAVRVHNLKAQPQLCHLRTWVEPGALLWEASFRMEPFEERTLGEVPGSGAAISYPVTTAPVSLQIIAHFEPVEGGSETAGEAEGMIESVALWNLSPAEDHASAGEQSRRAKEVVERIIWKEYIASLWPDERAQGIAWHALKGSSAKLVAEEMTWMVNDSPEEAKASLESFRTVDAVAVQEQATAAASRVEAYLKDRTPLA